MFFRKELTKQLQFSHSENQLPNLSFLSLNLDWQTNVPVSLSDSHSLVW